MKTDLIDARATENNLLRRIAVLEKETADLKAVIIELMARIAALEP